MKQKKGPQDYVKYVYYATDKDGIHTTNNYATHHFPLPGATSYYNHLHLFSKLSACSKNLLLYLVQVMDKESNQIINHLSTQGDFIDFMNIHCGIKYTRRTVSAAFLELKKSGYMISRTKYKRLAINPQYYFKGTNQQRVELFGSLIREATNPKTRNMDVVEKLGLKEY